MLYNVSGFNAGAYPFVLQPFVSDPFRDVRIILAGGYAEAYRRSNPFNFRKNISIGAESKPFQPTGDQLSFCRRVMQRGRFPYAHLDLMVFTDGSCCLSEIALDGGIRGAEISRDDLKRLKAERLEQMAAECERL
jgi:ribosomal protein S6--L-glutamate ligase